MTRSQTYNGIEFEYQKLLTNLADITAIASPFITADSIRVLKQCGENLNNIRSSNANTVQYWEIKKTWPVQTLESSGEYRASAKGTGRPVFALFSFRWGIKNSNSGSHHRTFSLVDEATTSIRVVDQETSELVALWQMEVGDASSPGCHFHASITERDYKTQNLPSTDDGKQIIDSGGIKLFPEWLKVPRLPSVIVTPFDALEFLLCELFQLGWLQAVSNSNHNVTSWSRSQNDRLSRLLKWKLDVLRNSQTGAWSALKRAKPNAQLFVGS